MVASSQCGHTGHINLTVERFGATAVLTVTGEVDSDTGYPMYLAAVEEVENGSSHVVLDLAGVTFVDSVGLGMLIRARDELATHYESSVALRNPSKRIETLLEMTGMAD